MGITNGQDFITRLNNLNNEIWLDGQRVEGLLSEHPAFKGIIKSKAALYDLQYDESLKDIMTFISPTSGARVGVSYLQPKTKEDLIKRRKMIEQWAKHSNGIMGRSPDYLNTVLMSFASSASLLEGEENCFANHLRALYERATDYDLSFTHTFISPQVNRSQVHLPNSKEPIAAKVVKTTDDGIVIKGARLLATQGGLTDEVLVFSVPKMLIDDDEAFAFSIPSNTDGLKFICRDSYVGGDSFFNHPLSSQFEEMDSIVVFDDVFVPWERVFYYNNVKIAESFVPQSSFHNFANHQVLTRQIVKTEFILGLAELLIQTINIREYPHIQEKMSEIIVGLETMKALIEKAENDAKLDSFGIMRPNLMPLQVASIIFPKMYPRFIEIIQLIGASGMISLPTENAFHSTIRPQLDQYLQGAFIPADERVKIFRLAWDLTMSAFGTRQTQYERFFYGDPVRIASSLYKFYPKKDYVNSVRSFLSLNEED
ncbi:4-hydroxyphenylacetate 3-monooxygenase, oxygenase component [Lysinibacillus sp. 2017]|uniref:4-hydroxyphenylacetate 3-monooxygenase, oxygenase component n=1 Tax=unclassified Lysinibacillus TaxID=2636778 RepID=UPI000D5282D3|nr:MULTISPECIES: 4-hydroxyphenylacetate 3-monooxygenase, oxygenase component [unclassified Lysinibacillus]AWE07922.1 4-hydroxyphenylacetate 3-monooxygenase, oxygenase component [Lysinibacillus sp. 2017]TGN33130.1 4-hydroxyphenylacetate 3-monooxygenase, oxygenase component [Lysinibacillus sp. S2017]